jgi:hypothetical protein
MHRQVFAYEINILLKAFFYIPYLNCFRGAGGDAFGQLRLRTHAIVTARIKIGNEIRKYYSKGTADGACLAACATHLIAFDMPAGYAFKGAVITGIHAWSFLAMPADRSECRVFA